MSRLSKLCSFCGKKLPPELLFTAEQKHAIEREEDEAKKRVEAAEEKRLARQGKGVRRHGHPLQAILQPLLEKKIEKWIDKNI